ncbi:MAG: DNA-binding MarR family transcriptional regulator [Enterobacterales bacterium]|jgi:DNA-binding MarR family transcriptional regulator
MTSVDFLDELGELALGSRLKRLSDRLMADASQVYKNCGHNVQPKWFALLALLHKRNEVSIVEASKLLGLSQPAISQFVKEMIKERLVTTAPSPKDSRRKFISLTERGRLSIENMKLMWRAVDQAAKELCDEVGANFFDSLKRLEQRLGDRSLTQRTAEILNAKHTNLKVEILEFTPERAKYFESINSEWIDDMFVMEDSDREILANPKEIVIDQGGKIYFARLPGLGIVGTCALLKKDNSSYELTKMAVLESARGQKIGETLLEHVVDQARELNIKNLYLLTNKICAPAIHLYLKAGFIHDEETMERYASKYVRCDVAMRYFD